MRYESDSPARTEALGRALGRLLMPGDLVALSGELGGGKTCFVRGIVAALAPQAADLVASPTYALMHEYPGEVPIYHFDCYRLRGGDDAFELGMQEQFQGSGICLLEWPERIGEELPAQRLEVLFEHGGDDLRRITLTPHGQRARRLLEQLGTTWA